MIAETIERRSLPPPPPGHEWLMGVPEPNTLTILPNSAAPTVRTPNTQGRASARQSPTAARSDRVLLCPWGSVHGSNGDFILDGESARMVLAAFRAQGVDLPIDYEHQTLGGDRARPDGAAPAAGWIGSLEAVPGVGLLAEVSWTPKGHRAIAAKEYRYLSPVVVVRKSDGRVSALHSVALTNKPAIVGAAPIVNRQSTIPPAAGAAVLACSGPAVATQPPQTSEEVWQANAALRQEFGNDKECWLNYKKANDAGLVQILCAADTTRPNAQGGCPIHPDCVPENQWKAHPELRAEFKDSYETFLAFWRQLNREWMAGGQ